MIQAYDSFNIIKQLVDKMSFQSNRNNSVRAEREQKRQKMFASKRPSSSVDQYVDGQYFMEKQKLWIVDLRHKEQIQKLLKQQYTLQMLQELVTALNSSDIMLKHYGMIGLRKFISRQTTPYIQQVVDTGMIPEFVNCIKQHEYPQLQMEAAWAFANIAGGNANQCEKVVECGAIPLMTELLKNSNKRIAIQAAWAVANIASDNTIYRDRLLDEGAMQNLIQLIEHNKDTIQIVTDSCWALSNLCRNNPLPPFNRVQKIIKLFCEYVSKQIITDQYTVAECLYSIAHQTRNARDPNYIFEYNLFPLLTKQRDRTKVQLIVSSLQVISSAIDFSSKGIEQTIGNGFLAQTAIYLDFSTPIAKRTIEILVKISKDKLQYVQRLVQQESFMNIIAAKIQNGPLRFIQQYLKICQNSLNNDKSSVTFKSFRKHNIYGIWLRRIIDTEAQINNRICKFIIQALLQAGNQDLSNLFDQNDIKVYIDGLEQRLKVAHRQKRKSKQLIELISQIINTMKNKYRRRSARLQQKYLQNRQNEQGRHDK